MKVICEMEKGFISDVNCIILIFEDNTEVRIGKIKNYDLDLNDNDCSSISFTTACIYNNLLNKFKKKNIKKICINLKEVDVNDLDSVKPLQLDILCNMKINRCNLIGDIDSGVDMYVELEGMVK